MTSSPFLERYGRGAPETTSETIVRRLHLTPAGRHLLDRIGPGRFDEGFFSIASVREDVAALGGWELWLPEGAFLFASSVFGMLYLAGPDDMTWLIHAQIGSIMSTDFSLIEAIELVAQESTSDGLLARPLFRGWLDGHQTLAADQFLLARPPVVESGQWSSDAMVPTSAVEFLAMTAELFEPRGPTPVSFVR